MRWVSLRSIRPNRVLAQNICDERGRVLLSRGMVLTPALVNKLQKLGVGSVCIEDRLTDDVHVVEFICPETRQQLLEATYSALHELAATSPSKLNRPPKIKQRLRPLLVDAVEQIRRAGVTGEHLGSVYLSDGELYHHSVNVTLFALSVAMGLNLPEEELVDLGIGTLLHDVGKLKIPDTILKKPGRLTDSEYESIKLHTVYGYELLRNVGDLSASSILVALEHHERVDGSGYPRGLRGSELHLFGRIAGVVDVYEALTANRSYRQAHLPHQAFELLLGSGGIQFDPLIIQAFIQTIAVYPVGMTLLLSTGDKAVVIRSPQRQTHRPVVRLIEDAQGNPITDPREIDLSTELTVQIIGCES